MTDTQDQNPNNDNNNNNEKTIHIILIIISIMLWFLIFSLGIFTDSKNIRPHLYELQYDKIESWGKVILTFLNWPITNLGLLSCIASILGGATQIINYHINKKTENLPGWGIYYAYNIVQGFLVYLVYLAGLLVFNWDYI